MWYTCTSSCYGATPAKSRGCRAPLGGTSSGTTPTSLRYARFTAPSHRGRRCSGWTASSGCSWRRSATAINLTGGTQTPCFSRKSRRIYAASFLRTTSVSLPTFTALSGWPFSRWKGCRSRSRMTNAPTTASYGLRTTSCLESCATCVFGECGKTCRRR